jgi:hypothetical protein
MTPLPDKPTCCGLSLLLSLIESVAIREPVADGLNSTLIEQFPPAATLAPHGFDDTSEKSFGLAPLIVIPLMVSAEPPVFVKAVVFGRLVELTKRIPKSMFTGTSFTVPEETVTVAATDFVESEIATAVSVTAPPDGTLLGAV